MKVRSILSVSVADWPEYNAYCRRYRVSLVRSCPDRFAPRNGGPRVDGYILTVEREVPDRLTPEALRETVVWFFRGFVAPGEVTEIVKPRAWDYRTVMLWNRGLITEHEMATQILLDRLSLLDRSDAAPVSA